MRDRPAAEIFSLVYGTNTWWQNAWGETSSETPFYSGWGSHDADIVDPYISSVRSFIAETFPTPPTAVDLGCGDFNVGRQIRSVTSKYTACDVVPAIIEHNRLVFAEEQVDFRVLDITADEPPAADVVFVRQVLQHLDNAAILRFLPKLRRYRWAVVTEHVPVDDAFVPNADCPTGGDIRLGSNSGVDLAEAPFNLAYRAAVVLCEVRVAREDGGRVRTTAYQLQD